MELYPHQVEALESAWGALTEASNALIVAPTGSGKTVIFSAFIKRWLAEHGSRVLVITHRIELLEQSYASVARMMQSSLSVVQAERKDWGGQVVFASVQTAWRLSKIPAFGLVVIDEAHHAPTMSWSSVCHKAQIANPDVKFLGVTATAYRDDDLAIEDVFSRVAYEITLDYLINAGFLVEPNVLATTRPSGKHWMDTVYQLWQEHGGERKTVIYCSTLKDASGCAIAFENENPLVVHGKQRREDRKADLGLYRRGERRVLINVGILTEGWDDPPTSCVVLLRRSSFKGTLVQMVGRGLRLSPDKTDCLILDFGESCRQHDILTNFIRLHGRGKRAGYEALDEPKIALPAKVQHRELEALGARDNDWRKLEWVEVLSNEWMAGSYTASILVTYGDEQWEVRGKSKGSGVARIGQASSLEDAFAQGMGWLKVRDPELLKYRGSDYKPWRWHRLPPSERMMQVLNEVPRWFEVRNKYDAMLLLGYTKLRRPKDASQCRPQGIVPGIEVSREGSGEKALTFDFAKSLVRSEGWQAVDHSV